MTKMVSTAEVLGLDTSHQGILPEDKLEEIKIVVG